MNVTLPPRFEAMIREKVESGRFHDASEVIEEALRLMEKQERLQRLRAELSIGLDQIERGDTVPYTPEFMERLKREAAEQLRSGKSIKEAVKP